MGRSVIKIVKSIFLCRRLLFLFSVKLIVIVGLMIKINVEICTKEPLS